MPVISLEHHLCSKFGPLRTDPPYDPSGTQSKSRLYKGLDSYTSWKDFTYKNMREHLGPYLNIEKDFHQLRQSRFVDRISNQRGLTRMISLQYGMIIDEATHAISEASAQPNFSGRSISLSPVMATGWVFPTAGNEQLHPDWAGAVAEHEGTDGLRNLLPGDAEYTHLEFREMDERVKTDDGDFGMGKKTRLQRESDYRFACIGHISACAYYLGTRYAYITTLQQVIFIRLSRGNVWTPGAASDPDLDLPEVSVVPWEGREDGMTVLHALLWIHHLACLERDIRDKYEPLGSNI